MEVNEGVLGGQSLELVRGSSEVVTSLLLKGSGNLLSEANVRV